MSLAFKVKVSNLLVSTAKVILAFLQLLLQIPHLPVDFLLCLKSKACAFAC